MPIQAIQKLIYRNLVQRPAVNRALDSFGNRLNRVLAGLGIQKRYATGLTRNKAILFASTDPVEVRQALAALRATERARAESAIRVHEQSKIAPGKEPYSVPGTTDHLLIGIDIRIKLSWKLRKAADILFRNSVTDPKDIIRSLIAFKVPASKILKLFTYIENAIGGNDAFEALPAALAAGLSPDKIVDLYSRMIRRDGQSAHETFHLLPEVFSKAKEVWSADQILWLLSKIINKINKYSGTITSLPSAIDKCQALMPGKQLLDIFAKTFETTGEAFNLALEAILIALSADLSLDDLLGLFANIMRQPAKIYPGAMFALPAALNKAKDFWTADQIFALFDNITRVAGDQIGGVFAAMPAALDITKDRLTPDQNLDFFSNIVDKTGGWAGYAFECIPAAISAKYLSPENIVDLFSRIVNKTEQLAGTAFSILPEMLQSRLSVAQISELFNQIVEKCGGRTEHVIKALPAALDIAREMFAPDQTADLFINTVEKCGEKADGAFGAMPVALAARLSSEQIVDLFGKIAENCGKESYRAFGTFNRLFWHLSFRDPAEKDAAIIRFLSMLDSLTDHNRERVLRLLSENSVTYEKIGPAHFLPHFNLYMDILTYRKRLGFALLEGVIEATKLGIIPNELSPEETKKINRFIDQTHSFSPVVYKVFRTEGDALLKRLLPLTGMIINDTLSSEAVAKVIKHYDKYDGLEFLYAVIQMAIPLSGASFVRKEEGKGLLKKMMEAGDLRNHVPEALRGITRAISLSGSEYALKAGKAVDLQAVGPILAGLRSESKADQAELVAAVEEYLKVKGERSEADKEKLRQVLYRYASQRDLLGEKVDRLGSTDYYTLRLLEEILRDKDCLASILIRAIEGIDQSLLATAKTPLTNPDGLLKAINKMWGQEGSRNEKINRLATMTTRYQAEDLKKLAASGKLLPEAVSVLTELLQQENQVYLSRHKLAEELLKEPLAAIQKEKAKFELVPTPEGINLSLRMVKGIPYSLWGLNAGVCIAPDVELWKDPNFKLIAMIDEETKTAVGFIHVYEVEIKGKKAWTLPGVEPSTEFIGTVNPDELLEKLMAGVVGLAQPAGIESVYIATKKLEDGREIISSNRSDMIKAIENKYSVVPLNRTIKWNRIPQPYMFEKGYMVWEGKQ